MKRGLGEIRSRDGCLSHSDVGHAVAGCVVRLDLRLVTPEKDEQTPLGARMFHRYSHQRLDQGGEDNLARECLRGFDYRLDVQLPDRRADCGGQESKRWLLVQVRLQMAGPFV